MEEEIITKLESALNEPIKKECQVVYILVEIRKLLERVNANYPLVKFYCDWCLHTKKDKIALAIKNQMEAIYKELQEINKISNGIISRKDSFSFASMDNLNKELKSLFEQYTISTKLLQSNHWSSFIAIFKQILIEQDIQNPCDGIKYFKFILADDKSVRWHIEYRIKEAEYKLFEESFLS